jgi:hypothetical protein
MPVPYWIGVNSTGILETYYIGISKYRPQRSHENLFDYTIQDDANKFPHSIETIITQISKFTGVISAKADQ